MGRYLVERSLPEGFALPVDEAGRQVCGELLGNNAECRAAWVHSYVTADRRKMSCIYDAVLPEAIRAAAERNGLRVDSMIEVRVLDPHFYA